MEVFEHGLTVDGCIALSDAELIDQAFDLAREVADLHDAWAPGLSDGLYFAITELIERFAPEAARAELIRTYTPASPELADPEDGNDLLDALEGLRRRQAARLLRDSLGEVDDG